jgi:MFS family permease
LLGASVERMFSDGLFPQGHYLVSQVGRAPLAALLLAFAILGLRRQPRPRALLLGCLLAPLLSEALGRRKAMALYFVAMGTAVAVAFGSVFYMPMALIPFFVLIFFLGFGGANFAIYTLWLPEQYSTDCRASAIAFVSSVGRFAGVAMVFLLGEGISTYGSLGVPVAATAVVFVLGLAVLPIAVETKGQPLPA